MSDAHERAGRVRARSELWASFSVAGWCEIKGQSNRDDVPQVAEVGSRRVQLGAKQRRELLVAKLARVDEGEPVAGKKVVGQCEEVVATFPIMRDHVGRES